MRRGFTQRQFSRLAEIPENRISELVRGWTQPTNDERNRISKLLNESADVLFADDVRVELRSVR